MSQELVTYIILGSKDRLSKVKKIRVDEHEQCLHLNFESEIEKTLDNLVAKAKGGIIVLLPPSSTPNQETREILKKISLVNVSAWGWFKFNKNRKNILQSLGKITTLISGVPSFEQGLYFSKRLYFSVGGVGSLGISPFSEISKRLQSRLDPQKPLAALSIRTKNLTLN